MAKKQKPTNKRKKRIVILGGGFAGVYTAKTLEKLFKHKRDEYEIALISRDNYFTFQPMIAEVVGGALGVLDSVSALRNLLKHTVLYIREISEIDVAEQKVTLSPNFTHKDLILSYDHLVIALGNVTDFRDSPAGLKEHALPFKNLSDAFVIRNRIIDVIETAAYETNEALKKKLLTFVVGGGGFSGIEVVAEINDLARKMAKQYPSINPEEIRVVLIHSKDRLVDKELSPSLGHYCGKVLQKRGVEIHFGKHLVSATPHEAILDTGEHIESATIISTVPSSSNPLVEELPVEKVRGRIATDEYLKSKSGKNIWALGDCAGVPLAGQKGKICPPTAQFATRQGKVVANNIWATCMKKTKKKKKFSFKALGMMAALGHRRAAAQLLGFIKLSGVFAWIFWRAIYWAKLPGFNRKLKVLFSWILDIIIPQENVQLKAKVKGGIKHLHYAKGDVIFQKGDVGDFLYVVVSGSVEILEEKEKQTKQLAVLGKGEYFGEMALLNQKRRNATVRCLEDSNIIAIRKNDFHLLVTNFQDLKKDFEKTEKARLKKNQEVLDSQGNILDIGDLMDSPDDVMNNETHHKRAQNE